MPKKKKPIDWAGIERDFCRTDLSVREIARWYGCDEKAIRLKAKAGGWVAKGRETPRTAPRDPQPLAALVVPLVERVERVERVRTPLDSETTKPEAIIGRGRVLVLRMLDELDTTTSHIGELAEQIEASTSDADNGRQREVLQKAISLPVRAGTLKNLALAMKTLAETATAAPEGKKAQRQASAERAVGQGRFAVPDQPRTVQ